MTTSPGIPKKFYNGKSPIKIIFFQRSQKCRAFEGRMQTQQYLPITFLEVLSHHSTKIYQLVVPDAYRNSAQNLPPTFQKILSPQGNLATKQNQGILNDKDHLYVRLWPVHYWSYMNTESESGEPECTKGRGYHDTE